MYSCLGCCMLLFPRLLPACTRFRTDAGRYFRGDLYLGLSLIIPSSSSQLGLILGGRTNVRFEAIQMC